MAWSKSQGSRSSYGKGPVLQDNGSLEQWLKNSAEGSWAVVQGFVEPAGPVIRSFSDKSIKGVIQRLRIKEFVTARNTSGFWQDGERVIADTVNTVPFGLRVGRQLVKVEEPLNTGLLTLRTVSSEFTQKSSHLLDHVWSFLVGTRHRGIESSEHMLLCGTTLTGIGTLTKDHTVGTKDLLLQPHCLSELSKAELERHFRSQVRWSTFLLLLSGVAGAAVVVFALRKVLREHRKKVEEEERRSRKFQRSREAVPGEPTCIVCENPREVILLPCGHICLCYDCSQAIERKCPMCRSTVESVNEYYIT